MVSVQVLTKRKSVLGWTFMLPGRAKSFTYPRLVTRPVLLGPGSAISVSISGYLRESSFP